MIKIPFQQWKAMPNHVSNYMKAKDEMLEQINGFTQTQAKELEESLNYIVTNKDLNMENLSELILSKIPSYIERGKELGVQAIGNESFNITTQEIEEAKQEYNIERAILTNLQKDTTEYLGQQIEVKRALSKVKALQGQISTIKGDLFEAFLQMVIPVVAKNVQDLSEQEIEILINKLQTDISKPDKIETQGNVPRPVKLEFTDDKNSISSQGKTDVVVKSPLFNNEQLNISAKNYSALRNIHILSKGNILGMVRQWPVTLEAQDYFLNALTVWASPHATLQAGKMLFAIQGLSGTSSTELKANVLILNINKNKDYPIIVVSIPDILKKIINGTQTNFNRSFQFEFKPELQLFKTNQIRTEEKFNKKINQATVSIKLAKAKITAEYLNQLL